MAKKFLVAITDLLKDELEPELEVLGDIAEITCLDAHHEDELVGRIEDADAIMMYHNLKITSATLDRLTRCKLIVRCGVGYDNIDAIAARERGIPVGNVPDYGTEEVADSAIGLTLALARGIVRANTRLRDDRYRSSLTSWDHKPVQPLVRLRGEVFGVVGLGRIGTATALRAKALGMDVVFYDPYKDDGYDKSLGIRRADSLEELLEHSYVVSLNCLLTDETRHLINAESIGKMRKGSFLVNTSRGSVVDTTAIPDAIASGQLAGAAIDVLADEPPVDDNPLIAAWTDPNHPAYDRVIINSHIAFYSEEGLRDMRFKGAQSCRRALLGKRLRNIVN